MSEEDICPVCNKPIKDQLDKTGEQFGKTVAIIFFTCVMVLLIALTAKGVINIFS